MNKTARIQRLNENPAGWDPDQQAQWLTEHKGLFLRAASSFALKYELEDLLQSGYETALRCFQSYDPRRPIRLSTYVYRSVRNVYCSMYRRDTARKRNPRKAEQSTDDSADPRTSTEHLRAQYLGVSTAPVDLEVEDILIHDYTRHLQRKCLTPEESGIFSLFLSGMTQKDIGTLLNVGQASVSKTLSSARHKMGLQIILDGIIPVPERIRKQYLKAFWLLEEDDPNEEFFFLKGDDPDTVLYLLDEDDLDTDLFPLDGDDLDSDLFFPAGDSPPEPDVPDPDTP